MKATQLKNELLDVRSDLWRIYNQLYETGVDEKSQLYIYKFGENILDCLGSLDDIIIKLFKS